MKKIMILIVLLTQLNVFGAEKELSETRKMLYENDKKLQVFSKTFRAVSKVMKPSVVSIILEVDREKLEEMRRKNQRRDRQGPFSDPFEDFFRRFFRRNNSFLQPPNSLLRKTQNMKKTIGSGVIISQKGYILTNNHVVKAIGDHHIKVKLTDGREYDADVVGTDPKSDIAVLKIKADTLVAASIGDSDKIQVGDWVVAMGFPYELGLTVTTGIVSAKERNIQLTRDGYYSFIQTDASINPGNSGGPLVNLRGELIGINTAIYSRSGGDNGIGFAIPINQAKYIYKRILKDGEIKRAWLGIQITDLTPELAEKHNLSVKKGILVRGVFRDSPAEKADIRAGDVVISYQGSTVSKANKLRSKVAYTPVGSTVTVTLIRKGKKIKKNVALKELKQNGLTSDQTKAYNKKLGITVTKLTLKMKEAYRLPKQAKGVLIVKIDRGSLAHHHGIKPGMIIRRINRESVGSLQDFNRLCRKHVQDGNSVRLDISTKRLNGYYRIPID